MKGAAREEDGVKWLVVRGARRNNLKNIDVGIPLGRFVCVSGVSGSGKSSLVNDIVREQLSVTLNGAEGREIGAHDRIEGLELLDKVIDIDQSPIGRTPRSNPATYIKLFNEIRDLYAQLPDSKIRGYAPGRFSFNVPTGERGGGRCEACEGNGANRVEMDFLADVWVSCPVCEGRRFNRETLQIHFRGKSIHDVLEMDVQEALGHFEAIPKIREMLSTLHEVGLDYVKLGQSSTTLSGGEAQRIKLARELVRPGTGRTLYLLDEPTTGLHFEDVRRLLAVLHGFVDAGNSVIVIEHNLDVIKTADWVIDLGPEGGDAGGRVVAEGTPEDVARTTGSHTGAALREALRQKSKIQIRKSKIESPKSKVENRKSAIQTGGIDVDYGMMRTRIRAAGEVIRVVGAREHNLKNVTVEAPRGAMTVCSGVSGSGKTSFAMDTVYVEGQRRYVESLSAYARQFLGQFRKPKVEHIEGLSPAIAIEQKSAGHTPRSTVGTVTEVYDYMRVLWARLGRPHCPKCGTTVGSQTSDEIVGKLSGMKSGTRLMLCSPIERGQGENWEALLKRCRAEGYARARIDGEVVELGEGLRVDSKRRHEVEVVVDRVVIGSGGRGRLADSVEHCLALGKGLMIAVETTAEGSSGKAWRFSQHLSCEACGRSFEELTPHHFSFNARMGWCPGCEGLGVQRGTSADCVFVDPERSILDGGVAGWEEAGERPVFRAMLVALAGAIGFDAGTAVGDLSEEHRRGLLFGLGDRWIEADESRKVQKSKSRNSDLRGEGRGTAWEGRLRFQWKGFYLAIDEATRVSWQYRMRLESMVREVSCQACGGARLRPEPAAARLGGKTIGAVCAMPLLEAAAFFKELKLERRDVKVAGELLHEIKSRIRFLVDVGLGYLSLARAAPSLSGGESQRIRLASQLGSGLTGVLYVLDEPTIGLHPRDNQRLVTALKRLRDLGNTLILVEHDREVIEAADHLLDFGPGAGRFGGEVVAAGAPRVVQKEARSLTGGFLSGREAIGVPMSRRGGGNVEPSTSLYDVKGGQLKNRKVEMGSFGRGPGETGDDDATEDWRGGRDGTGRVAMGRGTRGARVRESDEPIEVDRGEDVQKRLRIVRARQNNLKNVDVDFPLGRFICVTGVSGSGKSSLVTEILYPALASRLHRARVTAGAHRRIEGLEEVDKIIHVDQQPIGTTPQSNAATYCGVFDLVREVFARLPEAKVRGYGANRFSFNRPGGRCDACEGVGQICHAMHFLPDVWVECEACGGTRYQKDTLEVRFKGRHIAEVLAMSVVEALALFEHVPKVRRILRTLEDVGLGYLPLGQSAPTLSGGEAQRVKLAAELARPNTGRTVYVLDEPTTGLHFEDVRKLVNVLQRLVDLGNTVVCIEHNLDVIKTADWVIDLGPEAGDAGGRIVAAGTPEELSHVSGSHTGRLLREVLKRGPRIERGVFDPKAAAAAELSASRAAAAANRADRVKMPWERDGRAWHTKGRIGRDGKAAQWEGRALEFMIGLMEKEGGKALRATDWGDQARVEVCAAAPDGVSQGAVPWFCHVLTGGRWLIDFYFRVPHGVFRQEEIGRRLGLRKLDDRDDVDAVGSGERVQMRVAHREMDSIRVTIHDRAEADTAGMRWFLRKAMKAYLGAVRALARERHRGAASPKDGRARHLSQEIMKPGVEKKWKPATLAALVGMMNKAAGGGLKIDWSRKAFVELTREGGQRVAKVITHQPDGLRVDVHVARGALTPPMVEGLGVKQEFGRAGSSGAELTFWVEGIEDVDGRTLGRVIGLAMQPSREAAATFSAGE